MRVLGCPLRAIHGPAQGTAKIIEIDLVFSLGPLCALSRLGKEISQTFDNHFDFVRRGRTSKAEADGTHGDFGHDVHGFQNRRQFDLARMTGRSCCGGNAIEPRQYLSAVPIPCWNGLPSTRLQCQ